MNAMRTCLHRGLLCVALLACARGAIAGDSGAAEKDQKVGAQKTFEAGGRLYDGHHYEEALAAFRASYQIVPSPNSHLMIARCLRDLGHDVEAYREYAAVAKEAAEKGERYESAGHAAADEGAEVRQRIALLTLQVVDPPAGLRVKLGEVAIDVSTLGTAMPVEPGTFVVTADAPNGTAARADVTLAAGAASEVKLALVAPAAESAAPPPPAPVKVEASAPSSGIPMRTWAYVAGGVGVAGLATFGIFGAMSSSKYSSLDSTCPDHQCPPGAQDDISSGKTFQTIANVGLAVGIVGLGAGTALFILGGSGDKERQSQGATRLRVGVGSVAFTGGF
jgi:hypothetical protein